MGVCVDWCWCECLCTSIRSYDCQHWSALVAVVYCRMLQYSLIHWKKFGNTDFSVSILFYTPSSSFVLYYGE